MLFGGEDAVGKIAVVRDQNEAGRILIEPSGGEEPGPAKFCGDEVDHRFPLRVPARGNHARGLIEHQVKIF